MSKRKRDDVILAHGASTTSLQMLVSGSAIEERSDQPSLQRRVGTFWGELTWLLSEDMFNASPCEVRVTSAEAEVWSWDYATLNALCKDNDRLSIAMRDGFLRSACFKHGLLTNRESDQQPLYEPVRTPALNIAA